MTHLMVRIFLCFAIVSLVACASYQSTDKPVNNVMPCVNMCEQRLNACNQVCHNNCQECAQSSDASTVHGYNKYMNEACVQGLVVTRELQSYRDPLQCRKMTCNCGADYHICTQACSGKIYKRLQYAPTI